MDGPCRPHCLGLLVGCLRRLHKGLEGVGVRLSDHDDVPVEVEGEGSLASVITLLQLVLTHHLLCLLVSLGLLLSLELAGLELLDLAVAHGVDHVDLLIDLLVLGKGDLDHLLFLFDLVCLGSITVEVDARETVFGLRATGFEHLLDILGFFIGHVHGDVDLLEALDLHVCVDGARHCLLVLYKAVWLLSRSEAIGLLGKLMH